MSAQVSKDKFGKRLRIGVRFDGTSFIMLDGQPLPKLAKDSIAELVLAPESIQDERTRASLIGQRSIQFLKEDSLVLLGVSPAMIGEDPPPGLIRPDRPPIPTSDWYVEVQLNADLWLQVRGDDDAKLSRCPCTIPALKREAESLNHAFTLISEAYETKRLSHSGNVFLRGYVQLKSAWWQSLDELRLGALQRSQPEDHGLGIQRLSVPESNNDGL